MAKDKKLLKNAQEVIEKILKKPEDIEDLLNKNQQLLIANPSVLGPLFSDLPVESKKILYKKHDDIIRAFLVDYIVPTIEQRGEGAEFEQIFLKAAEAEKMSLKDSTLLGIFISNNTSEKLRAIFLKFSLPLQTAIIEKILPPKLLENISSQELAKLYLHSPAVRKFVNDNSTYLELLFDKANESLYPKLYMELFGVQDLDQYFVNERDVLDKIIKPKQRADKVILTKRPDLLDRALMGASAEELYKIYCADNSNFLRQRIADHPTLLSKLLNSLNAANLRQLFNDSVSLGNVKKTIIKDKKLFNLLFEGFSTGQQQPPTGYLTLIKGLKNENDFFNYSHTLELEARKLYLTYSLPDPSELQAKDKPAYEKTKQQNIQACLDDPERFKMVIMAGHKKERDKSADSAYGELIKGNRSALPEMYFKLMENFIKGLRTVADDTSSNKFKNDAENVELAKYVSSDALDNLNALLQQMPKHLRQNLSAYMDLRDDGATTDLARGIAVAKLNKKFNALLQDWRPTSSQSAEFFTELYDKLEDRLVGNIRTLITNLSKITLMKIMEDVREELGIAVTADDFLSKQQRLTKVKELFAEFLTYATLTLSEKNEIENAISVIEQARGSVENFNKLVEEIKAIQKIAEQKITFYQPTDFEQNRIKLTEIQNLIAAILENQRAVEDQVADLNKIVAYLNELMTSSYSNDTKQLIKEAKKILGEVLENKTLSDGERIRKLNAANTMIGVIKNVQYEEAKIALERVPDEHRPTISKYIDSKSQAAAIKGLKIATQDTQFNKLRYPKGLPATNKPQTALDVGLELEQFKVFDADKLEQVVDAFSALNDPSGSKLVVRLAELADKSPEKFPEKSRNQLKQLVSALNANRLKMFSNLHPNEPNSWFFNLIGNKKIEISQYFCKHPELATVEFMDALKQHELLLKQAIGLVEKSTKKPEQIKEYLNKELTAIRSLIKLLPEAVSIDELLKAQFARLDYAVIEQKAVSKKLQQALNTRSLIAKDWFGFSPLEKLDLRISRAVDKEELEKIQKELNSFSMTLSKHLPEVAAQTQLQNEIEKIIKQLASYQNKPAFNGYQDVLAYYQNLFKKLLSPTHADGSEADWHKAKQMLQEMQSNLQRAQENLNKKKIEIEKKSIPGSQLHAIQEQLQVILHPGLKKILQTYPGLLHGQPNVHDIIHQVNIHFLSDDASDVAILGALGIKLDQCEIDFCNDLTKNLNKLTNEKAIARNKVNEVLSSRGLMLSEKEVDQITNLLILKREKAWLNQLESIKTDLGKLYGEQDIVKAQNKLLSSLSNPRAWLDIFVAIEVEENKIEALNNSAKELMESAKFPGQKEKVEQINSILVEKLDSLHQAKELLKQAISDWVAKTEGVYVAHRERIKQSANKIQKLREQLRNWGGEFRVANNSKTSIAEISSNLKSEYAVLRQALHMYQAEIDAFKALAEIKGKYLGTDLKDSDVSIIETDLAKDMSLSLKVAEEFLQGLEQQDKMVLSTTLAAAGLKKSDLDINIEQILSQLTERQYLAFEGEKIEIKNSSLIGKRFTEAKCKESFSKLLTLINQSIAKGQPNLELLNLLFATEWCKHLIKQDADSQKAFVQTASEAFNYIVKQADKNLLDFSHLDQIVTSNWGRYAIQQNPELWHAYHALNRDAIEKFALEINAIYRSLFSSISTEELLAFEKYDIIANPHLYAIKRFSASLSQYVAASILTETNIHSRTMTFERSIWVMDELLKLGNLEGAKTIYTALGLDPAVSHLTVTKQGLSPAAQSKFAEIELVFNKSSEAQTRARFHDEAYAYQDTAVKDIASRDKIIMPTVDTYCDDIVFANHSYTALKRQDIAFTDYHATANTVADFLNKQAGIKKALFCLPAINNALYETIISKGHSAKEDMQRPYADVSSEQGIAASTIFADIVTGLMQPAATNKLSAELYKHLAFHNVHPAVIIAWLPIAPKKKNIKTADWEQIGSAINSKDPNALKEALKLLEYDDKEINSLIHYINKEIKALIKEGELIASILMRFEPFRFFHFEKLNEKQWLEASIKLRKRDINIIKEGLKLLGCEDKDLDQLAIYFANEKIKIDLYELCEEVGVPAWRDFIATVNNFHTLPLENIKLIKDFISNTKDIFSYSNMTGHGSAHVYLPSLFNKKDIDAKTLQMLLGEIRRLRLQKFLILCEEQEIADSLANPKIMTQVNSLLGHEDNVLKSDVQLAGLLCSAGIIDNENFEKTLLGESLRYRLQHFFLKEDRIDLYEILSDMKLRAKLAKNLGASVEDVVFNDAVLLANTQDEQQAKAILAKWGIEEAVSRLSMPKTAVADAEVSTEGRERRGTIYVDIKTGAKVDVNLIQPAPRQLTRKQTKFLTSMPATAIDQQISVAYEGELKQLIEIAAQQDAAEWKLFLEMQLNFNGGKLFVTEFEADAISKGKTKAKSDVEVRAEQIKALLLGEDVELPSWLVGSNRKILFSETQIQRLKDEALLIKQGKQKEGEIQHEIYQESIEKIKKFNTAYQAQKVNPVIKRLEVVRTSSLQGIPSNEEDYFKYILEHATLIRDIQQNYLANREAIKTIQRLIREAKPLIFSHSHAADRVVNQGYWDNTIKYFEYLKDEQKRLASEVYEKDRKDQYRTGAAITKDLEEEVLALLSPAINAAAPGWMGFIRADLKDIEPALGMADKQADQLITATLNEATKTDEINAQISACEHFINLIQGKNGYEERIATYNQHVTEMDVLLQIAASSTLLKSLRALHATLVEDEKDVAATLLKFTELKEKLVAHKATMMEELNQQAQTKQIELEANYPTFNAQVQAELINVSNLQQEYKKLTDKKELSDRFVLDLKEIYLNSHKISNNLESQKHNIEHQLREVEELLQKRERFFAAEQKDVFNEEPWHRLKQYESELKEQQQSIAKSLEGINSKKYGLALSNAIFNWLQETNKKTESAINIVEESKTKIAQLKEGNISELSVEQIKDKRDKCDALIQQLEFIGRQYLDYEDTFHALDANADVADLIKKSSFVSAPYKQTKSQLSGIVQEIGHMVESLSRLDLQLKEQEVQKSTPFNQKLTTVTKNIKELKVAVQALDKRIANLIDIGMKSQSESFEHTSLEQQQIEDQIQGCNTLHEEIKQSFGELKQLVVDETDPDTVSQLEKAYTKDEKIAEKLTRLYLELDGIKRWSDNIREQAKKTERAQTVAQFKNPLLRNIVANARDIKIEPEHIAAVNSLILHRDKLQQGLFNEIFSRAAHPLVISDEQYQEIKRVNILIYDVEAWQDMQSYSKKIQATEKQLHTLRESLERNQRLFANNKLIINTSSANGSLSQEQSALFKQLPQQLKMLTDNLKEAHDGLQAFKKELARLEQLLHAELSDEKLKKDMADISDTVLDNQLTQRSNFLKKMGTLKLQIAAAEEQIKQLEQMQMQQHIWLNAQAVKKVDEVENDLNNQEKAIAACMEALKQDRNNQRSLYNLQSIKEWLEMSSLQLPKVDEADDNADLIKVQDCQKKIQVLLKLIPADLEQRIKFIQQRHDWHERSAEVGESIKAPKPKHSNYEIRDNQGVKLRSEFYVREVAVNATHRASYTESPDKLECKNLEHYSYEEQKRIIQAMCLREVLRVDLSKPVDINWVNVKVDKRVIDKAIEKAAIVLKALKPDIEVIRMNGKKFRPALHVLAIHDKREQYKKSGILDDNGNINMNNFTMRKLLDEEMQTTSEDSEKFSSLKKFMKYLKSS